jgi:hypothetical protein
MSGIIDLHVHTNASDGLHKPEEVVAMALQLGLETIAITDHDTLGGVAATMQAAAGTGLRVIPGVEISTEAPNAEVHILGYLIDYHDEQLARALSRFRTARLERAQEILARLGELGIALSWEHVLSLADGGTVGRPHIARALRERGYVASVPDAFARYLANGQPAYVPRLKVVPQQAIRLIHDGGGIAVLAHPWEIRALLPDLVAQGLAGLEVYYTGYGAEMTALLRQLATQHGLLCTGGSDFHGYQIAPGSILGGVRVPRACLAALLRRHRERVGWRAS